MISQARQGGQESAGSRDRNYAPEALAISLMTPKSIFRQDVAAARVQRVEELRDSRALLRLNGTREAQSQGQGARAMRRVWVLVGWSRGVLGWLVACLPSAPNDDILVEVRPGRP